MKLRQILPLLCAVLFPFTHNVNAQEKKTLKVLQFTGGCCHDYDNQKNILAAGISERVNSEWTTIQEGGNATKHEFEILKKPDWAKGYDVVVWNICFAHVDNAEYVDAITKVVKEGVPCVVLHCTMHSHHWKVSTDSWEEFLGFTSPRHGSQQPITITNLKPQHPIMKEFGETWVTGKEELYVQEKLWPTATALADGYQEDGKRQVCVWVNVYGKARVFGTTLAHNNDTMNDPKFLDLISRGLLWTVGGLSDDGTPDPILVPAKK